MLTLAIDTATSVCSVALVRGEKLLAENSTDLVRTHSQRLLPMVENIFQEACLQPKDIKLLAVAKGPGSFTGLRIGIATVKGLGLAFNLPVVGISTLQALAHNFNAGLVCPVLNARLGQVYAALYRTGHNPLPQNLLPEQAITVANLLAQLAEWDEPIWFCGDGVRLVFPIAQKELAAPRLAPCHLSLNRAGALASLAQFYPPSNPSTLTPLYLRDSQAEIQLRQRLGGNQ